MLFLKFIRARLTVVKPHFTMAKKYSTKYVFVDLEMTGLDCETEEIMEVACVVTTDQLKPVHSGFHAIPQVNEAALSAMDPWCTQHHGKSGLTEQCRNSKVTLKEVENQLIAYVKENSHQKDTLHLAGNTVYMDRRFLAKYMKTFDELLHYRIIDVSSIKTLCSAWYPGVIHKKKLLHRALEDVYETIDELQFYRESIFK